MAIIFIPLYIDYLGIEAYGLIGLFTVMQVFLNLLDMGISPTLGREMAKFKGGLHTIESIHDLLRSLEIIIFSFAIFIALFIWSISDWLASEWLLSENLAISDIVKAISVSALVIGLRFCENIYRSAIIGLQEQVWFNTAFSILNTLRFGGAVLILAFVSSTISAFFYWQAVVSFLTISTYFIKLYKILPSSNRPARFSYEALSKIWKFAGGILGINFLSILLTQIDKVLLSHLLSLEYYGYYTLAGLLSGILYLLVFPIREALYPRMVELYSKQDHEGFASVYHLGSQLVTITTVPIMLVLAIYTEGLIYVWSGDLNLVTNAAPVLTVLIVGTFLNCLMGMPYQGQLAHGWTSLALKIDIIIVAFIIPAIFWFVPIYGAMAAASIWVIINAVYVFIGIHIMHKRILIHEKWRWYINDILVPMFGATVILLVFKYTQPSLDATRIEWSIFLLIVGMVALISTIMLSNLYRPVLIKMINRFYS